MLPNILYLAWHIAATFHDSNARVMQSRIVDLIVYLSSEPVILILSGVANVITDTATPRRHNESLKNTQRARFLEKFKAAKVIYK